MLAAPGGESFVGGVIDVVEAAEVEVDFGGGGEGFEGVDETGEVDEAG